jgi:two-component system, NtrC family, response regulator AtoC
MMAEGNTIDLKELPDTLHSPANSGREQGETLVTLEEMQNRYVLNVLKPVGGNKARAAEILGISRTTIYEMLAKLHKPQLAQSAIAAGLGQ